MIFLWFTIFFQRFSGNKKKINRVTVATRRSKPPEGVIWPILDSLEGKVDGFKVGGEVDYHL